MSAIFLTMTYSVFLTNFEIKFWTETVKSRWFKKNLKRRKTQARFCWVLVICMSVRKNYRKPQICCAGTLTVAKINRFLPNFDPIFGECEKGAKYMFKKVNLNLFKELNWKYRIAFLCILTHFHFAWKGTLRP